MVNKKDISSYGGWLFLLLCVVLLRAHSSGMITLYVLFCMFYLLKIPKPDKTSVLLLFFSIFYISISFINGAITSLNGILIYGLPWVVFYLYGRYVTDRCANEKSLIDFFIIIGVLSGFTVYYTIIAKIIATGSLVDLTRGFFLFGDETQENSAIVICVSVFMGYAGLSAFVLLKEWKLERWLFLALFILSSLVAINVVSRFPIVVSVICFLIVIYVRYRGKPITFIGILLLFIGLVFVLYYQVDGFGEVFSAYADRNADIENVRSVSDRTYRWVDALVNMYYYPFGWYGRPSPYTYAHNMWLDIAKYSGIIPFTLLSIATIQSFVTNYKIIRLCNRPIAYIFLSLNLCFVLVAFVQPVYGSIEASLGCLVWGMQNSYLNKIRNFSNISYSNNLT